MTMKTLLVPTDFSPNAENAMYFAFQLARKMQAGIILMHAYRLPIPVADIPYHILAEEQKNKEKETEALLRKECSGLINAGGPEVEYLAVEGFGMDAIIETAEKRDVDYIIMGTKGRSNLAGTVFGSITSRVIERSKVPVMAIPQKIEFFQPIKKITYATNYHRSDIPAIRKIAELAAALDARVHILHITNDDAASENETASMQKFNLKIKERIVGSHLSFQVMHGPDVEQELQRYVANEATDMLVLSTHVRNLADRIFGTSLTRHLVLNASIPVIAFHYRDSAVTIY